MAKPYKDKSTLGRIGRVEREQRNVRVVTYTTIGVVVLTMVLAAVGVVWEFMIKPAQPVAIVNSVEITTEEFAARVRYERGQMVNLFNTYYQYYQFTQDPGLEQQLQYMAYQLQSDEIALNAYYTMIDDVLIQQEAKNMGIRVSKKEVDTEIEKSLGYFPDGTPAATLTPVIAPSSTLSATQLALITSTPTMTATLDGSPTVTPTLELGVTLVPPSITPTISVASETFTPTVVTLPTLTASPSVIPPTATPYTYDAFQELFEFQMADMGDLMDVTEEEFRAIVETQLLRQKVFEEITQDIETEREHVWIRQIVVENEDNAINVLDLLNNGDDWAVLTFELSIDTSVTGPAGDVGWIVVDNLVDEYADVVIDLEVGEISTPIEILAPTSPSGANWIIIQILGRETRVVDPQTLNFLKQGVFEEWLDGIREDADIQEFDYWLDRAPDKPSVPLG